MVRYDPRSGIRQSYSPERVQPFVDAGLLAEEDVPNKRQVDLAAMRMSVDVILPYADEPERYAGTELGPYPLKRFANILRVIGPAHLDFMAGFAFSQNSVAKHVLLTLHPGGNPVYDLQMLQTNPGGLDTLREWTDRVNRRSDADAREVYDLAERMIPDAKGYRQRIPAWIDAAERFEYPIETHDGETPDVVKDHYFDLLAFLRHASADFSKEPRNGLEQVLDPILPGLVLVDAWGRGLYDRYVIGQKKAA